MTYTISIDYDQFPDLSWLEETENPMDHVTLDMILYDESGQVVDSLSGIDFYEAANDWTIGTFDSVDEIPAQCGYLREIADAMIEAHIRIEADRYLSLM